MTATTDTEPGTEPASKLRPAERVVSGYRKLRPAERVVNGYRKLRRTNKHAAATVHELGVLREELKHTAAGWVVPGRETNPEAVLSLSPGDSPPFVCKELALRYGLVQLSAYVDYDRLCDSTGQPDATKRIARITEYLDEMDQLRNLERRIQPLLPEDADTRQALIDD